MSEVSGRVTAFLLEIMRQRGVDAEELLAGTALSEEVLSDSGGEVSWEVLLCLLDRIEDLGGIETIDALGPGILDFKGNRPLRALARVAWTEQQFLRLLLERIAPSLYRVPEFAFEALEAGRSRLTVRIPASHPGSENFMRMILGVGLAIPRFLGGSQDADIEEFTISPRLGFAVLRPTLAPGLVARGARTIAALLVGNPAFAELERRHRRAEETTRLLEAGKRSLATFQAVADSITQSVDFAGTAQRIVDAVTAHTDFSAVTLYTVSEDGDFLELTERRGPTEPGSIPERMPIEQGTGWRALREQRVICGSDQDADDGLGRGVQLRLRQNKLRSVAVVPLLFHDQLVGTLGLASREYRSFSAEERASLLALGKTAAAALMGARHVSRIEHEVRDRARAEAELRVSQEHLQQIAENVEGTFYLLDATTNEVLYLSPNFEQMTGHSSERIRENRGAYFELVHPDDRERIANVVGAPGSPKEFEIEYRIVRPDGSIRDILERTRLVRGETGEPLRIAGFGQDVTRMRELERQLRHSQKMDAVGKLAGGIAHDFNNLLTVILFYATILRDRAPGDDAREAANEIMHSAESASALTGQLLALARKQPVSPQSLDLGQVIEDMLPTLRSFIGEGVQLEIDTEPSAGLVVRIDRGQLEQVLVNLAVNARDAMPAGGTLRVSARASAPASVRLCVRDTGIGMEPEVLKQAFEPFFSTKDRGQGTGLGLASVSGIVEQAGGRIRVESSRGKGTTFEIELPQAKGLADPAAPLRPVSTDGHETLLVVEDRDDVRGVAVRALRARGYHVIEARNGREALELAQGAAADFSMLVTDIVMPGMSGIELSKRLTEQRPGLPVLFVSGYPGDGNPAADDPAVESVLMKPFTSDALADAVRERLDAGAKASDRSNPRVKR